MTGSNMAPKKEKPAPATFAIGDIVLSRIKGYSPWPAKIVDPETEYLTKDVLAQKPLKKTTFLVRYYDEGNYSWSSASDLKHLSKADIEAALSGKQKGAILSAYKTAGDPEQWEAAFRERQEEARQKAADRANGKDELESESEAPKAGSKRKRTSKAKEEGKAAPKKAKTDKKLASKKIDPANQGEKLCKDWRHVLQKTLLTDGKTPTDEELASVDATLTEMQAKTDVKGSWLAATKLPKVLRRIVHLAQVPQDEKYTIKSRSEALLESWRSLLGEDGETALPTPTTTEKKDTNGDAPAPATEAAPVGETAAEDAAAADETMLTELGDEK